MWSVINDQEREIDIEKTHVEIHSTMNIQKKIVFGTQPRQTQPKHIVLLSWDFVK